jgi:5-methylcytosine-specific restriction enzyme A
MIEIGIIKKVLTENFGLPVEAKLQGNNCIVISPTGINPNSAFSVEIIPGWRRIQASFKLGNYSRSLITSMSKSREDQKVVFTAFSESIIHNGGEIDFQINHQKFDPLNFKNWPSEWNNFHIRFNKIGVIIEDENSIRMDEVLPWIMRFWGMIQALLPVEDLESEGQEEGDMFYRKIKSYERSRLNRVACIEYHGNRCVVCNIDFGEFYGPLGDGFIHIHHIVPISQMNGSYIINPREDLVPVCPNCHAMLHRNKENCLSVEYLKNELKRKIK